MEIQGRATSFWRANMGGPDGRRNEFLAGERRRVVDGFIAAAAGVLSEGLGVVERNGLEINLRFYVETQLAPGLLAVNALLLGASPGALERDLPEWIERASTVLPACGWPRSRATCGGGLPHRGWPGG